MGVITFIVLAATAKWHCRGSNLPCIQGPLSDLFIPKIHLTSLEPPILYFLVPSDSDSFMTSGCARQLLPQHNALADCVWHD
jgi:hypothetical protein